MTTIGQVPATVCVFVTVRDASGVQPSAIETPRASNAATVVTAGGALAKEHPWTLLTGTDPVMTGAVSSTTLMTCCAVELLPHASIAVHVLVTVYSVLHGPGVVTSLNVRLNELPHASLAVAWVNTGVAGQ